MMNFGFGMNEFGMGGFGLMETLFPIIFFAIFAIVIGMFIFTAFQGIRQWNRNNHSPRLTVFAQVVNKRTKVGHQRSASTDMQHHSHSYTHYYVTFEVESGDRMEFQVTGEESGMLVEGDRGQLTFQGTRYLGFVRQ